MKRAPAGNLALNMPLIVMTVIASMKIAKIRGKIVQLKLIANSPQHASTVFATLSLQEIAVLECAVPMKSAFALVQQELLAKQYLVLAVSNSWISTSV